MLIPTKNTHISYCCEMRTICSSLRLCRNTSDTCGHLLNKTSQIINKLRRSNYSGVIILIYTNSIVAFYDKFVPTVTCQTPLLSKLILLYDNRHAYASDASAMKENGSLLMGREAHAKLNVRPLLSRCCFYPGRSVSNGKLMAPSIRSYRDIA